MIDSVSWSLFLNVGLSLFGFISLFNIFMLSSLVLLQFSLRYPFQLFYPLSFSFLCGAEGNLFFLKSFRRLFSSYMGYERSETYLGADWSVVAVVEQLGLRDCELWLSFALLALPRFKLVLLYCVVGLDSGLDYMLLDTIEYPCLAKFRSAKSL